MEIKESDIPNRHLVRFQQWGEWVTKGLNTIVKSIYPPRCACCEQIIAQNAHLCAECWRSIIFIEKPYCAQLGTPFGVDYGVKMLSPAAIANPPDFDTARAVARHHGAAKTLVTQLKYHERLDLVPVMGRLMRHAGRALLKEAEIILPVPMHVRRLWWRRYNQAALLAREIARESRAELSCTWLRRAKSTPPQVGLTRNERQRNLSGAFILTSHGAARIAGKRVLLVDDVRTTGATLNACARVLRKAGATHIDALTFTMVVFDDKFELPQHKE